MNGSCTTSLTKVTTTERTSGDIPQGMASRFSFPSGYDVNMHREEILTLQRTASQRNAAPNTSDTAAAQPATTPSVDSSSNFPAPTAKRRHFVFADPVAFRYLEEDPCTLAIERHGRLQGYELYVVEQWFCSRVHPTFIIATYTGDPNHFIGVGVLGIPSDEESWSPRLRVYFKAISQYHARPKETPLGMLLVTNLSSFPSALTVIPVPDGDIRKHREDFVVNEDLKRLGCSGRSGMSLSMPAGATQAKFLQLYKTSDRIPLYGAVIELVKLCQVALMIFGKLEQEYADGCLCDVTEKAINEWWTEIGSEYYNIEPTDGILGPTTVAALLGLLMGARNRLHYLGAPVTKDAFDVVCTKRGIAYFQKSQKMDRTRRLDRRTLERLHRVTAKAAAGEGWAVPKAVKSTVVELSGKGGEMVMGMVTGRDKSSMGDIETVDIDRFVSLVHGQRAKWLWHGKPRRTGVGENYGRSDPGVGNLNFTKDDQGGYMWSHTRADSIPLPEEPDLRRREKDSPNTLYNSRPPGSATNLVESPNDRDLQVRKTVFRSVTGKMSDARSGFGRIKDAVGLRGHASKHSKDENAEVDSRMGGYFSPTYANTPAPNGTSPTTPGKAFSWKTTPGQYQNGGPVDPGLVPDMTPSTRDRESESPPGESRTNLPTITLQPEEIQKDDGVETPWILPEKEISRDVNVQEPSVAGSVSGDGYLEGPLLEVRRGAHNFESLLQRRHSISAASPKKLRNEAWWPRQMSFSDAEEAVLSWDPVTAIDDDGDDADTWAALQNQNYIAEDFRGLQEKVSLLQDDLGPWVENKVDCIEALDGQATRDREEFQTLYYELSETYDAIRQASRDILADERSHGTEALKNIELLGAKLEYEVNAVVSKVQDVEDGVAQYELLVRDLENQAVELEMQLETHTWSQWAIRCLTGLRIGPDIRGHHPQ